MKVLKIGRDEDCDIRISDEENRISRVHAFLRIHPFGGIEIIDNSKNGTKVGGNPISQGQPYPVKRNETVNFADVRKLDWRLVPNPRKRLGIVATILAVLAIVVGTVAFALNLSGNSDDDIIYESRTNVEEQPSQKSTIARPNVPSRPVTGSNTSGNQNRGILVDEDGHRVYEGIFTGKKEETTPKKGRTKKQNGDNTTKDEDKKNGQNTEKNGIKGNTAGKGKVEGQEKLEDNDESINEIL